MSKTEIKMRERIIKKIEQAGAVSKRTAVSVAGADLDLQEQYWLPYLVGTVHDGIKKTEDSKYYRKVVVL
ncbi:MAG: hypothetical protein NWF03_07295 [Candidatus Bathyarchaeota archaeon]|nr:hypothetical protein [Candidatus Bathyarchaeota archaeon]